MEMLYQAAEMVSSASMVIFCPEQLHSSYIAVGELTTAVYPIQHCNIILAAILYSSPLKIFQQGRAEIKTSHCALLLY